MINSLEIEKFRLFKNNSFDLGRRITVIAGQNATGKSTLLGILGNMVELKEKNIFGKKYRTEFSEIFKSSIKNDPTGEHKGKINFCKIDNFNTISSFAYFRSTWQNNGKRFRIIPNRKDRNGKKVESKYPLPVIYLGLSRLYPLGEVTSTLNYNDLHLSKDEKKYLFENYKYILSLSEKIEDISNMSTKSNNTDYTGIKTKIYDELCNSSGQNNLGQILLSLLSFERLYNRSNYWDGGLLLVDEMDSTLHPAAQLRLLDILFKKSKELNLQIVFTTHSTVILEYIAKKYERNVDFSNDYKLFFISTANDNLRIYENPSLELMRNNLFVTTREKTIKKKILVYSEDDDTRWFFKKLVRGYGNKLKILNINLGCSQLKKLLKEDYNYFSLVLFVVDGDVKITDKNFVKNSNVLSLISNKRPEKILYDYLNDDKCSFWDSIDESTGFTKQYLIIDNGPFSSKYNKKTNDRKKYSSWFYDFKDKINKYKVFEKWKEENKELVIEFRKEFIQKFNKLAEKQEIETIIAEKK